MFSRIHGVVFPFVSYFLRIKTLRPKYEGNQKRKTFRIICALVYMSDKQIRKLEYEIKRELAHVSNSWFLMLIEVVSAVMKYYVLKATL
jgi:hypothetical protein